MDNTRDELLELIRNATNIDMICFFAIIYVVAPDSPPYTPTLETIVEENQTLFDMIQNALDETLMNTKQLYVLYDDAGKLTLKNINTMKLNLLIDEETGENFSYESSIDEQTYNKIKLA